MIKTKLARAMSTNEVQCLIRAVGTIVERKLATIHFRVFSVFNVKLRIAKREQSMPFYTMLLSSRHMSTHVTNNAK